MSKQFARESQLSREAWLERALKVLRDEGIQGVRVERLARDLGTTKGSFYWHFKDRDDLWKSILQFWDDQYTGVIVDNPDFQGSGPAEGMLAALTRIRKEGLDKYELAMRAWADHDSRADQAVRKVYDRRMKFIRAFFKRLGFRGAQLEVRTRLTLCYLCWEQDMFPDDSESHRLRMLKLQHKLLIQK